MEFLKNWAVDARKLVFDPKEFYRDARNRRDFNRSVAVAVFSYLLGGFLAGVVSFVTLAANQGAGVSAGVTSAGIVVQEFAGNLVLLLLAGFIVHLVLHWLGKGDFRDTLEVFFYAAPVYAMFGWIPFLNILGFIYGVYVKTLGIQEYRGLEFKRALLVMLSPVLLLAVLLLFFVLAATVAGAIA